MFGGGGDLQQACIEYQYQVVGYLSI